MMSTMRIQCIGLVVAAMSLVQAVPLRASASFPDRQVIFTYPGQQEANTHIGKIRELLSFTDPDSDVWAAVYLFTHKELMDAFAKAEERGVNVHILTTTDNADVQAMRSALEALAGEQRVFSYSNGMGNKINHNKFVLFTKLVVKEEVVRNVVVQSSANWTYKSMNKYQNTVILVDDALLDAYVAYWYDLLEYGIENRNDLDYYTKTYGDNFQSRVYFSPRDEGDTVVGILRNVRCSPGPGRVRVLMARWKNGRIAIAEQLVALKQAGCDVQVVTRKPEAGSGVDAPVLARLTLGNVPVSWIPIGEGNIHSKYFLVDAVYKGSTTYRERIVWTGSHNFTKSALRRNDEALLKIRHSGVYRAFLADWEVIRGAAQTQ